MFDTVYSVIPAVALTGSYYGVVRKRGTTDLTVWLMFAAYWLAFVGMQEIYSNTPTISGIFMGAAMALGMILAAKRGKVLWPLVIAVTFLISSISYAAYYLYGDLIDRRAFQDFTAVIYYLGLVALCTYKISGGIRPYENRRRTLIG